MKNIFKKGLSLLIAVVMSIAIAVPTFATNNDDSAWVNAAKIVHQLDIDKVSNYVRNTAKAETDPDDTARLDKTYGFFRANVSDGTATIQYNKESWSNAQDAEREKASKELTATINSWGLSSDASQKIYDDLKGEDRLNISDATLLSLIFSETRADLSGAMGIFSPFQGTLGLVLGIGVVLIIIMLLLSTVMDLVYIGIPMVQNALDGKDAKNPFGVSRDAYMLVKQQGEKNEGGNIYVQYLKKRIVTYIILAICILYLISGQIAGIIGWLLDLVSGFGA